MVFGKGQNEFSHRSTTSQIHPSGVEFKIFKPTNAMVFQSNFFCGAGGQIDPFSLNGSIIHTPVFKSSTQVSHLGAPFFAEVHAGGKW